MKNAEKIATRDVGGGAIIAVKAVPSASRDRIVGVLGNCLKVTTSAPPEKGRANKAIAAILAQALGVAERDVAILSGLSSPRKEYRVVGLSAEDIRRRIGEL